MSASEPQPVLVHARYPRRSRWVWPLVFGALFFLVPPATLILWFYVYAWLHPAMCEVRKMLARAPSPDGLWIAAVYDSSWTDGGFVTTFTETVEIARPDEKASSCPSAGTVFAMDAIDPHEPIALIWTGPRSLEITIPNDADVGTQTSAFEDLGISYKYVPDDPIERACWKQWRSLPSEEVVRLMSGPAAAENFDMFFAKCHAEAGTR